MVHPQEGKQYKLRLIKGGTTVDVGFFDANSSLSAGAQTLDNGSWTVQLFEDNVLKQNYCTLIIAQPQAEGFSNVKNNGADWNSNLTDGFTTTHNITGNVGGFPAGTKYGMMWRNDMPTVGSTYEVNNEFTESGGAISGSVTTSEGNKFWLVAYTPGTGNQGTILSVYPYYIYYPYQD